LLFSPFFSVDERVKVHPVPGGTTDQATLDRVYSAMAEAGLYLMYDMRGYVFLHHLPNKKKTHPLLSTYQNASSVTDQVNHIKSLNNLLLWYTADEPDGTSDPLDATVKASHLISSLDGSNGGGVSGYHPISLVLNCQNYFFEQVSIQKRFLIKD